MEKLILDHIPFRPDAAALMEELRVRPGGSYAKEFMALLQEGQAIARPKAMYRVASIDSKGDDYVIVDSIRLSSRVLRVNLEEAYRVFLFVATGGMELEDWTNTIDDMLMRYWADWIAEKSLRAAIEYLQNHLTEQYQPGPMAEMHPGSLADWPIREQRPLFTLLGDPQERIGVRLTDSMLMVPSKSVSGIRFPTESSFESCQLCPLPDCPNRKAPYDKALYERKYAMS